MIGEKRAVLDFIQNLAVELKKVSDKNRKRREDIHNNPDIPIREQISASGEWHGQIVAFAEWENTSSARRYKRWLL